MSTTADAPARAGAPAASGLVRAFQVFAALSVVNVLVQFISAGQLFPNGGPEEVHAAGAIVLHVLSGLAAIAAVLLWRQGRVSIATAALAASCSRTRSCRLTGVATPACGSTSPAPCCSPSASSGSCSRACGGLRPGLISRRRPLTLERLFENCQWVFVD